jgi:hypothetical protein
MTRVETTHDFKQDSHSFTWRTLGHLHIPARCAEESAGALGSRVFSRSFLTLSKASSSNEHEPQQPLTRLEQQGHPPTPKVSTLTGCGLRSYGELNPGLTGVALSG